MKDIYETITIYRYISLVITSICYLINTPTHDTQRKILIIGMMVFSAVLMNYLYKENRNNKKRILSLVIIEIIGNSLLIIPSGGIYSPYVWYAFNTVLIAGVELKKNYVHIILMIYMACIMSLNSIYPYQLDMEMIGTQYIFNMTIGIIFTGLIVQVVSNYAKEIENQKEEVQHINDKLREASMRSEESLQWLMDTYAVINLFSIYNTKSEMIDMLLNYIVNVLQVKRVAFIEKTEDPGIKCTYSKGMTVTDEEAIIELFKKTYTTYKAKKSQKPPMKAYYHLNEDYLCIVVGCSYEKFGYFIVEAKEMNEGLIFIKQLSDLIFKKLNLEKIEEELLINKEQNRIANEIHDSVLQQLFGVGCSLFTLEKKMNKLKSEEITEEIIEQVTYSRQMINNAMTELRKIIYGMSWNKQGTNQFLHKIEAYIEGVRRLYDIDIRFKAEGNLQEVDIKLQGAIYRIICEGIANGVRHSKATQIQANLKIRAEEIQVEILDNGVGFDYQKVKQSQSLGLGIKNMEGLVSSLGGLFEIDSKMGESTKLRISLPMVYLREGVAE